MDSVTLSYGGPERLPVVPIGGGMLAPLVCDCTRCGGPLHLIDLSGPVEDDSPSHAEDSVMMGGAVKRIQAGQAGPFTDGER